MVQRLWFPALILVGLLWAAPGRAQQPAIRHVFLIQNSGFMEPFYHPPNFPAFRDRLQTIIGALVEGHPDVVIASFNQDGQAPGHRSPLQLSPNGGTAADVAAALNRLDLPRKPNGYYFDSDFVQAVSSAVGGYLSDRQGIVWVVTNNQNSPDNTPQIMQRSRDFLEFVDGDPSITGVVALPELMQVTGGPLPNRSDRYSQPGFVVYGFAYGPAALEPLLAAIRAAERAPGFGARFAKLKPLEKDPVFQVYTRAEPDGVKVDVADNAWPPRKFIVSGLDEGRIQKITLYGKLVNNLFPQAITRTRLAIDFNRTTQWEQDLRASHNLPETMGTSSSEELPVFEVKIDVPPMTLPTESEINPSEGFAGLVYRTSTLKLDLIGMDLGISGEFRQKMEAIFGLDQIPNIFLARRKDMRGSNSVQIEFQAIHEPWWGALLPFLAAGLGLGALAFGGRAFSAKTFMVPVGTGRQAVRLRMAEGRVLTAPDSSKVKAFRWFGEPTMRPLPPAAPGTTGSSTRR
jgi:hypothetical protein